MRVRPCPATPPSILILRSGHSPRLEGRRAFGQAIPSSRVFSYLRPRCCGRPRLGLRLRQRAVRPLDDRPRERRGLAAEARRAATASTASASMCSTAGIRIGRRTARPTIRGRPLRRASPPGWRRPGDRLTSWGFNSVGGWSLPPQQLRLPAIIDLELGRRAQFHWFDPFSSETAALMMATAREAVAPYRGSPYRIGYFSDNEVGWWAGALFRLVLLDKPASLVHQAALGRAAVPPALCRRLGGRFTADFRAAAAASIRGTSCCDVTGMDRICAPGGGRHNGVVREWCGLVAERYYTLAEKAIRAADPDALYFGDRLPIYYDPAAVRRDGAACGRDRRQLQRRCRATAGLRTISSMALHQLSRRKAGPDLRMVLRGDRQNRTGNAAITATLDDGRDPGGAAPQAAAAATRQFRSHAGCDRRALVPVLRSPERRTGRSTARTTISPSSTSTTPAIGA